MPRAARGTPQAQSVDGDTTPSPGRADTARPRSALAGIFGSLSAAQATVMVAVFSLLGGVIGSFVAGSFEVTKTELQGERDRIIAEIETVGESEVEKVKNDGVISADKFRMQRDLIVKAIDKPNAKEVRDALKFFAESGLIVDFEDRVKEYLRVTPDDKLPFDSTLGSLDINEYVAKVERYRSLLDLIGKGETGGNYEAYHGKADNADDPKLTEMKITDLRRWQDQRVAEGAINSGAGKYMLIRTTIDNLVSTLSMSGDEPFSPRNQDILAVTLLEHRRINQYITGRLTREGFALQLAMEWASLPVLTDTTGRQGPVKAGQSFYSGDGLNKASISVADFTAALDDISNSDQAQR